ncbi:hypothetical protein M8J75_001393 [Diaphorina citri]|nr:hypothetical protein M8J75_001393 [Diaphorina citri]
MDLNFRKEIAQFIEEAEGVLQKVTKSLNWKLEESQETLTVFKSCPINKEHRVPENNMKEHVEKCRLRSQGYSLDDNFLEPLESHLIGHPSVVQIDKYKQQKIFAQALKRNRNLNISTRLREPPLTFDRYLYEFTSDERYILYDYAVQKTSSHHQAQKTLTDVMALGCEIPNVGKNSEGTPQTLKDLLAAERDAKRRRQAYRKKNPDQDRKKSDTETFREVIQSQMEFFFNYKDGSGPETNPNPVESTIEWRHGRRLNVPNNHRQWEVVDEVMPSDIHPHRRHSRDKDDKRSRSDDRRNEYYRREQRHGRDRDKAKYTHSKQSDSEQKEHRKRSHSSRSPDKRRSEYYESSSRRYPNKHRRSRSRSPGRHRSSHYDTGRYRSHEKYRRSRSKSRTRGTVHKSARDGEYYREQIDETASYKQYQSDRYDNHRKHRDRSRSRDLKSKQPYSNYKSNTLEKKSFHEDSTGNTVNLDLVKQEPESPERMNHTDYLEPTGKLLPPSARRNSSYSSESSFESTHGKIPKSYSASKKKKSKKDRKRTRE